MEWESANLAEHLHYNQQIKDAIARTGKYKERWFEENGDRRAGFEKHEQMINEGSAIYDQHRRNQLIQNSIKWTGIIGGGGAEGLTVMTNMDPVLDQIKRLVRTIETRKIKYKTPFNNVPWVEETIHPPSVVYDKEFWDLEVKPKPKFQHIFKKWQLNK